VHLGALQFTTTTRELSIHTIIRQKYYPLDGALYVNAFCIILAYVF